MDVNGIPLLIVVGVVVVLAVIIARVWRTLLKWALIIGGVVVLVVGLVTFLPGLDTGEAGDTVHDLADIARVLKPEPAAPAPTYTAPASNGSFIAGMLVMLLLGAAGAGAYFYIRWKMAERGNLRPAASKHGLPGAQSQPIIYVIEGQADDIGDYDLIPYEEEIWTADDLFQF